MAFDIMHMKRIIRSWCVAEGITYEELAERLDVPMPTLKSWIYGTNRLALINTGDRWLIQEETELP